MYKILKNLFFVAIVFLISGCASLKTPKISNSFQITILSPAIKINDVGFLHKSKNSINLQIYSSGINTLNIKINDKICTNQVCYEKLEFNKKFLGNEHYEELFSEILQRKPIYNRANLETNSCGFKQDISKYSLKYEVCHEKTSFQDTKNRIKIIIKELK
ncbi:hypothetical protein [Campylobacter sp. CCUG 57310]|uniref:hypothetical protein n=1 Tax=Campylobacter sp. CCUG 57310 TaxID=2517362 RepID=UPI0015669362|nr:hypothetical protein [Campylobacter sp. CCUG 57310]QKF92983.1 putative lipoprotein [Campylobacter sp. CCUG 57310]